MKVILLHDVKNVGKKGEIKEVSDGYGRNFLINNKHAVVASGKSQSILEQQNVQEKLNLLEKKHEAEQLVEVLGKITLEFYVKGGKDGRVFGSISTKQICEELYRKHQISVDKRKFVDKGGVTNFGYSDVKVELYKEVIGVIRVHLNEK